MGTFRTLDEVSIADCALEVTGESLADLFETAALALAETMVDPASVDVRVTRRFSLAGPNLELLFFDWLSELICRKDEDSEVFTKAQVAVTGKGPYRLDARLQGGRIVSDRTIRRADPKGVTFHQFVLEPLRGGWRARVVIDL